MRFLFIVTGSGRNTWQSDGLAWDPLSHPVSKDSRERDDRVAMGFSRDAAPDSAYAMHVVGGSERS